MNQAHFHLLINHFPVVGTVFGGLILLVGYALKHTIIKQLGLLVFILSALGGIPAFLTGEGAEDVIENIPGILNSMVETHEELATAYIWLLGGLGLLSLLTLLMDLGKIAFSKYLYISILIFSMITIGVSVRVGITGGEIRHAEIRKGVVTDINLKGGEKEEENE